MAEEITEKPMDKLMGTLAAIGKKIEASDKKIDENSTAFETMKTDLENAMDEMKKARQERETVTDSQGPTHSMVTLGKAKGLTMKGLWDMRSGDGEMRAWQAEGDELLISAAVFAFKKGISHEQAFNVVKQAPRYKRWASETEVLAKALTATTSTTGLEFVPEEFSADLIERVTLGLRVAGLHPRMPMPRSPYRLPAMVAALPKGFKVTEQTSDNFLDDANTIPKLTAGTRKVTWDALGVGGLSVLSAEFDEDSIVPGAEFARDELVTAIQNAQEAAVMNGSQDGTHPDFDTNAGAATLPEKLWDGYREIASKGTPTTLDFAGAPTSTLIRTLRSQMGRYGASPQNLAYVMSITLLLKHLIGFPEFLTLDKIGAQATVLTGQLAQFDGSPVVVSDFARDDLSATGFNTTGGPNTKSSLQIVHRPSMRFGDHRGVNVETIRWPVSDQVLVVGKARMDFEAVHDPATEDIVASGINITL